MEGYARNVFGISPRKLYYPLALQRTLNDLPGLRQAFLSGRLTMKQTLLLGSVVSSKTEEVWLRRAGKITLRRMAGDARHQAAAPSGREGSMSTTWYSCLMEELKKIPRISPRFARATIWACSMTKESAAPAERRGHCSGNWGSSPSRGHS
jgi:hypothetical protein